MLNLKRIVLGHPLKNSELKSEKLSRLWGLPIMASDAVSSVAYAIEEILLILIPAAGLLAFGYVPWVVVPILLLLIILVASYSQIINHFPRGGGAYIVAKENIGSTSALITAAALIIDYIMTVAVSISSATAAIASAFPYWDAHRVPLSLALVGFITLMNLRGLRESAKIFGLPTYLFIFSMVVLIGTGLFRLATGTLQPIVYSEGILPRETVSGIGLLLILRAFSSGCSAMAGVEAVSDAVPSFKEPSQRNARHILYFLAGIIVVIFGGTSILAVHLQVAPMEGNTVISQIAGAVFGNTLFYYLIQIFTAIILILAANTAYNGLPLLLSILAHDGYVPRQFSHRGTKLSFSNGIVFIFIAVCLLIIQFKSDTHKLIPLYSVGVFISFTFAQLGMFIKLVKEKEKGWQYKCGMSGFGAVVTFTVTIIVFSTKFLMGAWMLALGLPLLIMLMLFIKRHYDSVTKELELKELYPYYAKSAAFSTQCIVLIHDLNKAVLKALNYANSISNNITALHICRHPEHADKLRSQWEEFNIPITLEIIETPYRDIIKPFDDYICQREKMLGHGENLSVIIIKYVSEHWFESALHNQTTYFLEKNLSKHKNVSSVITPFHYKINKKDSAGKTPGGFKQKHP